MVFESVDLGTLFVVNIHIALLSYSEHRLIVQHTIKALVFTLSEKNRCRSDSPNISDSLVQMHLGHNFALAAVHQSHVTFFTAQHHVTT